MFMLLGLMGAVLVGSAVMLQTDVLEDEDIPEEDDSGGDDYGNMFDQIPIMCGRVLRLIPEGLRSDPGPGFQAPSSDPRRSSI